MLLAVSFNILYCSNNLLCCMVFSKSTCSFPLLKGITLFIFLYIIDVPSPYLHVIAVATLSTISVIVVVLLCSLLELICMLGFSNFMCCFSVQLHYYETYTTSVAFTTYFIYSVNIIDLYSLPTSVFLVTCVQIGIINPSISSSSPCIISYIILVRLVQFRILKV